MERDICRFVADSGLTKRGILAPRGVGKSHFISAGYATWRLLRDPNTKILIISKSKIPQARDCIRLIRGWLRNVWFLGELDPSRNTNEGATDQTFQFDVAGSLDSKTPSVMAQGIEGHITGSRAHLVIADDIETDVNTKTMTARQELDQRTIEFFNIATYGDKETLYVGTYWHEESVYLKLAKRGYTFRTWPFAYPQGDEEEKFLSLAPIITENMMSGKGKPGHPTFSHRYTIEDVIERKSQGRTNWLMQNQLVCNLGDSNRYPIKLRDLIIFPVHRDKAPISISWGERDHNGSTILNIDCLGLEGDCLFGPAMIDREWQTYTGTKAYIDPAGKGQDLTGLAIVSQLAGMLWVKGVYGLPGGASSERLSEIAELLRRHGVRDCYLETNIDIFDSYRSLLEVEMRKLFLEPGENEMFPDGWKCSLDERRASSMFNKEMRIIQCLEPVISSHRMVMDPEALRPRPERTRHHELQHMMAMIRKERGCLEEDGPIDALAGCVAEWQGSLRMDPQKGTTAARKRAFDEALKEHFRQIGQSYSEPRWFSNTR